MPKVIGVRFKTSTRMYYFAPTDGETYPKGTVVIVETQRGTEMATVVMPETEVDESRIVAPLKPVLRIATADELAAAHADDDKKQEILATAKQKAAARGLEMKIVDCEFTVDHSKLVLYFTAEQRVDFRELVRDLASAFRIRIDLRQIGSREECKLIGSLGCCGLPCCCGRFESDSEHVSIKMAKNQSLALTPNKINGMCGRLMCCLSYENKTYEDILKRMPKHGATVTCPDGRRGTVVSNTPLTEKVRVRVGDDDNFEFVEYTLAELNGDAPTERKPDPTDASFFGRSERDNAPRGDKKREKPDRREADEHDCEGGKKPDRGGKRDNRPFGKNKNKNKNNNGNNANFKPNGNSVNNNNNAGNNQADGAARNGNNADAPREGGNKKNRNRNRRRNNKNNNKKAPPPAE